MKKRKILLFIDLRKMMVIMKTKARNNGLVRCWAHEMKCRVVKLYFQFFFFISVSSSILNASAGEKVNN